MASIWIDSVKNIRRRYPPLKGDLMVDVLVVGGGLAGVLCAHQLARAGIQAALVERGRIGLGVTGNTTAKVTAQHGAVYANLLEQNGVETARGYYDAQTAALNALRDLAEGIPCDFEEKTAYLYAHIDRARLEREAGAYQKLGIPYTFREGAVLPGGPVTALGIPGQAQINPLKLLYGAADGLTVFENTEVKDIDGNRAVCDGGTITARHIILATHYPMVNIPGLYFMKLNQQRSYVVALENAPDVEGMYIGLDGGKYSLRNYGDFLLVGGGNHTTGKEGGQYAAVREHVAKVLPAAVERFAWATQDCMSLDQMPYIGQHRQASPALLVATGFNKWGMTGSMLAAILLTRRLTGTANEVDALFAPGRKSPAAALGKQAGEAIKGYLHFGKRCSHMGCGLHWNEAEKSWDCPCHGSRFAQDGRVLDNPAKKGIKP